mmetsp:Transcript_1231/g.2778  ORF Transcript_1231/g.2778 Transcript_1231/m.2778 type:complete len:153 (-) Transcript_1231:911-1369(-)
MAPRKEAVAAQAVGTDTPAPLLLPAADGAAARDAVAPDAGANGAPAAASGSAVSTLSVSAVTADVLVEEVAFPPARLDSGGDGAAVLIDRCEGIEEAVVAGPWAAVTEAAGGGRGSPGTGSSETTRFCKCTDDDGSNIGRSEKANEMQGDCT